MQTPLALHHHDLLTSPRTDSFLRQIDQRPLRERRKLLNSKSRSEPYPCFLYKYRPLSVDNVNQIDSEQTNRLREYIVESRLWLSSPASFNDPFDMRGRHIFDGDSNDKRKHIIKKLIQFRPDLTRQKRELAASELLASGTFTESLDGIHEVQRQSVGICSFAGDSKNILMWSHYGSNHTGICFQFQLAQDVFIFSHAIKVEYSNEYPVMDYLEADYYESIIPTLFRKAKGWKYEQERRIVHPNGANCYLTYKPSALTALILGCEMRAASENIVKELLIERQQKGCPPVKIFRACRHDTQYRLYLRRQRDWLGSC